MKEVGITRFLTSKAGQYRGTLLAPAVDGLPEEVRDFFYHGKEYSQWIVEAARELSTKIGGLMVSKGFQGRVGMDMMVVKNAEGALRLRAPLEINPRATMGHVGLRLRKRISNDARGVFLLLGRHEIKKSQATSFSELITKLGAELPPLRGKDPSTHQQGVLTLNDPLVADQVLALCVIAPSLGALDRAIRKIGLSPLF